MDSGNSGSISSSGDEEYDSSRLPDHHHHHTQFLPSTTFLNQQPPPQFGYYLSNNPHHAPPSFFDLSSNYLHALSQQQQNTTTNPNCTFLNLETGPSQTPRSEPDCTAGASSSCLLPVPGHQGQLVVSSTDAASLQQLRTVHEDSTNNNNPRAVSSVQANAARNPKKRTRASRRAPTTVLTTDTSNFRAMVQEFTGIPAPPFSGSSYSRRLDLLTGSSAFKDSSSSFYPLRPSPQRVNQNPLLFPSSSSSSSLLHNNNHTVDANAATNNSYQPQQQLPPDLGLPAFNNNNNTSMLSMQNQHPILPFHPSLHAFGIGGFGGAKPSQAPPGLTVQSLEDLGVGVNNNAHLVRTEGGGGRDPLMSLDGSYGGSGRGGGKDDSGTLNGDKSGGSGAVDDSWICSTD